MAQPDNLGDFIKQNKDLFLKYLETRFEIFRLQAIGLCSKTIGSVIWLLIALFFALLIFVFTGLVLGFWLSELLNSYVKGFGLATLLLIALLLILTIFRRSLFVNPIIRQLIRKSNNESSVNESDES